MAFRDILVHIDRTPDCERRVKLALDLAATQGADLTGLFSQANTYLESRTSGLEKRRATHQQTSNELRDKFQPMAKKAKVKLHWETAPFDRSDDVVTNHLVFYSQHADLILVGQHNPDKFDGSIPADMAGHLVLETGRPVLVVPYAGTFPTLGKRVVIAWNTARESVRAVNDAIPLMGNAKKVKVVAINPHQKGKRHGDTPSADIVRHLQRHGIPAEADHFSTQGVDEGNLLLNIVSDERADLLVMGAYGHQRFRELVLGGVTREILAHMTTPVLMSH
ncbi:MAG: universal stress protein [Gammaproteobacteria bacterium]|nr:universal stress protein [Gammaproteobacteria bacterium]